MTEKKGATDTLSEFGELSKDKAESQLPLKRRHRETIVDMLAKNLLKDEEVVKFKVCEPVQKSDRLGLKWTEYKIKVEYENGDVNEVQRRYKHFVWLRSQLSQNRGVLVPPLPEKNYMNRFDEYFIEKRRACLEQFLMRVLAKETLSQDNSFRLFIQ